MIARKQRIALQQAKHREQLRAKRIKQTQKATTFFSTGFVVGGIVLSGTLSNHAAAADVQSETTQLQTRTTSSLGQDEQFIAMIAEQARTIASEQDLYASVMIAQAALESGFGTSGLSASPNYNLFGIKGSYQGASVTMATNEDDGTGNQYTIKAGFRRYNSYEASLQDYASVIKETNLGNGAYYAGAWRSNTMGYQEATQYLQGRYATSTQYAQKLNELIERYQLTQYDQPTVTSNQSSENVYTVQAGDTLWAIAQANHTTVEQLKIINGLQSDLIQVGELIQVC